MKTRLMMLLLLGGALCADGATLTYQSWRFNSFTNNRAITISLRTDPLAISTNLVFGAITVQPTNGQASFTREAGGYWLQIDQVAPRMTFDVPDTTNTYNLIDLINRSLYVLSVGASNTAGTLVSAGTNITATTNGAGTLVSVALSSNVTIAGTLTSEMTSIPTVTDPVFHWRIDSTNVNGTFRVENDSGDGGFISLTSDGELFANSFSGTFFGDGSGLTVNGAAIVASPFTTNVVAPQNFTATLGSSDWNPIVISGAGTAAANGSYTLLVTNANSGIGYAVWKNGSTPYYLIFNDTNQVSSVVTSNLWTIENIPSVGTTNELYELLGNNPFGTWATGSLGVGTPGSDPTPQVGARRPSLIIASSAAPSNSVLLLSPGVYDIGQYTWFPTNLTVIAYGATIYSRSAAEGIHPYGPFAMYGGTFICTNLNDAGGSVVGSEMCNIADAVSNVTFIDCSLYGATDVLINSRENQFTILANCDVYHIWDGITLGAGATTNASCNVSGCRFYSISNRLSTVGAAVSAVPNSMQISGCIINTTFTNFPSCAVLTSHAAANCEISGTVINVPTGGVKLRNTAGTLSVQGRPYNYTTEVGAITHLGWKTVVNTNLIQGLIYSNFFGVPLTATVNIRVTTGAAAGDAQMDFQEPAGTFRKRVGQGSASTLVSQTNNFDMTWIVPVNGTYAITSTITTGSGYSVSVNVGQLSY